MNTYQAHTHMPRVGVRNEPCWIPAMRPMEVLPPPEAPVEHLLLQLAELWRRQGSPRGLLLHDGALQEAEEWASQHDADLTAEERDFLHECREPRTLARRERIQAALVRGLLVAATIIGLVVAQLYCQARQQGEEHLQAQAVEASARTTAEAVAAAETEARLAAGMARATAVAGRRQAEGQSRQATSRALAAYAAAEQDRSLAILLALESVYAAGSPLMASNSLPEVLATLYHALGHEAWQTILDAQTNPPIYLAAWGSDDGRALTVGPDGSATIWDLATGKRLQAVAEGDLMATEDRKDTAADMKLVEAEHVPGQVMRQPWTEKRVCILASYDGDAHVYLASVSDLAGLACSEAGRNLTPEERQRYLGSAAIYLETCPGLPAGQGKE